MKKEQERLEKQLAETQAENRRLQEPLQKVLVGMCVCLCVCMHVCVCVWLCTACTVVTLMKSSLIRIQARDELAELKKQLTNYERDKLSLAVSW